MILSGVSEAGARRLLGALPDLVQVEIVQFVEPALQRVGGDAVPDRRVLGRQWQR